MKNNFLFFLLQKAATFLDENNYERANFYIEQILKIDSRNSEAYRLRGVQLSMQGEYIQALNHLKKAVEFDKKNSRAYSNIGINLTKLKNPNEAIPFFKKSLDLQPNEPEVLINFGNAYYDLKKFNDAILFFEQALKISPQDTRAWINRGNALLALGKNIDAKNSYLQAISISPQNYNAKFHLAIIQLSEMFFVDGWQSYKARWGSSGFISNRVNSEKPFWDGKSENTRVYIWGEQGMGDQILFGSMLHDLRLFKNKFIVSIDKKLLNTFRRNFPYLTFIMLEEAVSEDSYDFQIPLGDLGQFFRKSEEEFFYENYPYLYSDSKVSSEPSQGRPNIGIAWSSSNPLLGSDKTIKLDKLVPILKEFDFNLFNLQYGDTKSELAEFESKYGYKIYDVPEVNLSDDIEGVLDLIQRCDFIITVSNTLAHLAGSIGKQTYLLLPKAVGKFWYWHKKNNISLWYPSVRIFQQEIDGEWDVPIEKLKIYLENSFAK